MVSCKQIATLLAVFLLGSVTQVADAADAPTKLRILGVGNSFTQNATNYLPQIIESDEDVEAEIALAYRGGSTLEFHVTEAMKHEADSETGKAYRYRQGSEYVMDENNKLKMYALKEILLDGKWDYITIQQGSPKSPFEETFYPYARELHDYIKRYAPDAAVVVHETWPYRQDSPRLARWEMTSEEMYEKLHANYTKIAEELDAGLIPVGTAFHLAKQEEMWNFQLPEGFDMAAVRYPEDVDNLPDQSKSLNRGFRWRADKDDPEKKVLHVDAHHANGNGSVLAAFVWYKYFFNKDPRALTIKPSYLSEEQADSLKACANKAFEGIERARPVAR